MFRYLLFLALLTAARVHAQAPPDTTIDLPEAVVEADGDALPLTASRLQRLDARVLSAAPNESVADVLARTGNVYVQRYGPSGLATASFRGTGGKNTAVYLDGLLLSDPQANQIDLAVIPLVMIESIDVEHGAGSAAASTGAMGGSVFLNTRRSSAGSAKITAEGGQYGRMRLGATGGADVGPVRLSAAAEVSQFDGDYPYTNPTLINSPEQIREGADKSLTAVFASADYSNPNHRLKVAGWLNAVERGLPGPGNAPPPGARQWDDQHRAWLSTEHDLGGWSIESSAVANRTRMRYVNDANASNDTTITNSMVISAAAERVIGSNLLVSTGLSGGSDWSSSITENHLAVFADATWNLNRLYVMPSIRFETRQSDVSEFNAVAPRLGLAVALDESREILLKSNIGRSYRMPSFLERFWVPGGNPDLLPEKGWGVDAGLAGKLGSNQTVDFETTVFFTRMDDQIAWYPSFVGAGLQVWTAYNVGLTYTYGLEYSLEANAKVGSTTVRAGISGMLNRAVDRSDEATAAYNHQLRYVPNVTTGLAAGIDFPPFSVDLSGRHVGPRYLTSDESMEIDAYLVFDGQLAYALTGGRIRTRIALQAENLLNADYSVIRFYPMPPRMGMLRIDIQIK